MSESEQSAAGDEPSKVQAATQPAPHRLRDAFGRIRRSAEQWSSVLRWGAALVAALIIAISLLWIIDKIVFYYLTKSYVDQIADAFDLNRHLANALLIATFVVAVFFARLIWSFSKQSRFIGVGGIALLLIGHSLALWYATRNNFFDTSGKAVKCYVLTRDGKVTYGERAGIDPATGRLCRPITAEMLERLQQYADGKRPQLINATDPVFFDPRTGEPIVWYFKAKDGTIQLFDLMGFHPDTGDELLPVTKEIAQAWKAQIAEIKRHVPNKVDPDTFVFFDPRNGVARAWYWRGTDGKYEFYDSPGFEPASGEPLKIVTRDILNDWKKTAVKKAPRRVDPAVYAFFDPVTGVARVWYWRGSDGSYEFYDAPGYQPTTGEPLQLVTKDIVAKWKEATTAPKHSSIEPSLPPTSSANPKISTAALEMKARSFLFDYMRVSSGSPAEVLNFANAAFADQVDYFGKRTTKDKLIEDKRAYMVRWPERTYQLKPETIFTRCDTTSWSCEVGGEFYFRAASAMKTSIGTAINRLVVAFYDGGPKILSENGNVISRGIEQPYSTPTHQPVSPADAPTYPLQDQQAGAPGQQNGIPPEQARQLINGIFGTVLRQMGR
jgi:hypothetical protein